MASNNSVKGGVMVYRYRVVACGALAGIFVWTGQASAGWVIDQVMKGGGEGTRQQVLLQANRIKTLMLGEDGAPVVAVILDLNAETITQVDYKRKHYISTTVQEFGQMLQGVQQAMSGEMAEAMKQVLEQMKDMPEEQRKMVEQMMRSRMPKTGPSPQDCVEPKVELKKTDQQATIAGYPAVRYDVLADGKPESELWLASGIAAWREMDPQKLQRFVSEMAKLLPRCVSVKGQHGFHRDDPAWKLASEGYPVRTVHHSDGEVTIEVVKAESRSVPAAEFQPPAGFVRTTLLEMMEHQ
jgi:ribosomal protein S18